MSTLPEVSNEEIYKSLYERLSGEVSSYREQVVTLEILATMLRDQRDEALREVSEKDNILNSLKNTKENQVEGDLIED